MMTIIMVMMMMIIMIMMMNMMMKIKIAIALPNLKLGAPDFEEAFFYYFTCPKKKGSLVHTKQTYTPPLISACTV